MHLLVEEFLKDNLEFKLDILETLENHREEFIDWRRRPQSKSGGRRAEGGGRRAEGGGRRAARYRDECAIGVRGGGAQSALCGKVRRRQCVGGIEKKSWLK